MSQISMIPKVLDEGENCCIYQCVILKPDGSEEWIKRPGDIMTDYEVIDIIINRKYVFEEIWQVPV